MSRSYEELKEHLNQMLSDLRKGKIGKDVIGYIWRVEYGLEKGYHVHLATFFNGQRRAADIYCGQQILERWKEVVGSEGSGFVCNLKKEKYKYCGLGTVARSDERKWGHVRRAMRYLTKPDVYARPRRKAGQRYFGVGGAY